METKTKILVVDDDPGMREVCCAVLQAAGFDTSSEADGFQALLHLAGSTPDIILCDLNMPRMSGFEFLSVVRRKFPQVRVVAMSGAYVGDSIPGGVLADAFYSKGQSTTTFVGAIKALLKTPLPSRQSRELAAVWMPVGEKNSQGKPFVALTCPDCFRTFPLATIQDRGTQVLTTACVFCDFAISYSNDFPRAVTLVTGNLGQQGAKAGVELALEQSAGALNDEIASAIPFI